MVSQSNDLRSFVEKIFLLNLLLKKQLGRDRRPNIVAFVVWSPLFVSGWVVVAWARKSYLGPAEISSLCTCKIRGLGTSGESNKISSCCI